MHPAIPTSLVSPSGKNPLTLSEDKTELICEFEQLAFPIENGIPILLMERARPLQPTPSQEPASKEPS